MTSHLQLFSELKTTRLMGVWRTAETLWRAAGVKWMLVSNLHTALTGVAVTDVAAEAHSILTAIY